MVVRTPKYTKIQFKDLTDDQIERICYDNMLHDNCYVDTKHSKCPLYNHTYKECLYKMKKYYKIFENVTISIEE